MVVARQWAEQRVLMRAFAACDDQTRPTINLHGSLLSIGPAGTDPHGEWGIHVEPPVDGRAQELREALELSAKLLAGSKGNPPRLEDEIPQYEDEATGHWAPNNSQDRAKPSGNYYEPAESANAPVRAKPNLRKTPPTWGHHYDSPPLERGQSRVEQKLGSKTMSYSGAPAIASGSQTKNARAGTNLGHERSQPVTPQPVTTLAPVPVQPLVVAPSPPTRPAVPTPIRPRNRQGAKTMHGFSSAKKDRDSYAVVANKTLPVGFHLENAERALLDALGEQPNLSASEIGALLQIGDPMRWMAQLMDKLASFGLDLVAPGEDRNGEPTYVLVY